MISIFSPIFAGPKEDLIGYYVFDMDATKKIIKKTTSKLPKNQRQNIFDLYVKTYSTAVIRYTESERIKVVGATVDRSPYDILKETKKSITIKYGGITYKVSFKPKGLTLKAPQGKFTLIRLSDKEGQAKIDSMKVASNSKGIVTISSEDAKKIRTSLLGYYQADIKETVKGCEILFAMLPAKDKQEAISKFEKSIKNSIMVFTEKKIHSYSDLKIEHWPYEVIKKEGETVTIKYGGVFFDFVISDKKVIFNVQDAAKVMKSQANSNMASKMKFTFLKISEEDALKRIPVINKIRAAKPKSLWTYSNSEDKMRNIKTMTASNVSLNKVKFKFPYNGGSQATVILRIKEGFAAMLIISKGQFNSSLNKFIYVKFDNGPIEKYSVTGPRSGGSDIVFITAYKSFASKMLKAKKMIIEATFYSEGTRQFEFNVIGLNGFQKR
ncbi:MAG: hypothetical protein COA79_04385 [Planctomycetota bacterium]|nr:MAG: hypothetical protein COA79_04385 [Planctomycetota bacterium]